VVGGLALASEGTLLLLLTQMSHSGTRDHCAPHWFDQTHRDWSEALRRPLDPGNGPGSPRWAVTIMSGPSLLGTSRRFRS
jgi:hypothetical protein